MTSCCAPPAFLLGCRLQEAAGGEAGGVGVSPRGACISKTQPQITPAPPRRRKTGRDNRVP